MEDKGSQRLRSLAEAHLFVAVAKADAHVSAKEILTAVYQAKKSQKKFNFLNANASIMEYIRDDIFNIFNDFDYYSWDSAHHVEEAIKILQKVKTDGKWAVKLTADKLENGLEELASVDGYNIMESRLIKDILKRLREQK
ncbi:MAG: hypothetical protein Q4F84_07175 [Fibrobacter sp.]|nr:hypothetical protein [Fibrobacter sp.]